MKTLISLLIGLVLASNVAVAGFNDFRYKIGVYDSSLGGEQLSANNQITSEVLAFVYTTGTKTLATLYSDAKRTSLANPITRTQFASDDMLKFYAAAGTVDIVLAHSDGSIGKYGSVTPSVKSVRLDRSGVDKCLIVAFSASDNDETDTEVDLPYNVVIYDAAVEVVTADATETLNIGLLSSESGGDADGILASVPMTTAGYLPAFDTVAGANQSYVYRAWWGALMGSPVVGTDSSEETYYGISHVEGHRTAYGYANSVTYTGSSGSDTAAGYIYLYFRHIR